jgi:hypothetical protein
MSPATAAGLTQKLWDIADIAELIEAWEGEKGNLPQPESMINLAG